MRLKLLVSSLSIVLTSLLAFGVIEYRLTPDQSIVKALSAKTQVVVNTKAFTATQSKDKANWLLTLKKDYFPKDIETVAVTYNDMFYGIFLISDPIYLPVLVMNEVAVVISPLDKDGNPLTGESFIIGDKHDSASP